MNPQRNGILLLAHNAQAAAAVVSAFRAAHFDHPIHLVHAARDAVAYIGAKEEPYTDTEKFPPPELLLVDTGFKPATIFDLIARIRENAASRNLPVLLLADSEPTPNEKRTTDSYNAIYEAKPLTAKALTELAAKIGHFWLKPRPAPPPPPP